MSSAPNKDFFIRPATAGEAGAILGLIKELAEYEKALDQVKATEESIRTNVFEKRYANAILAVQGTPDAQGDVFGMALYFFTYSTWTGAPSLFLEDLYVSKAYRNGGVGKVLFGRLGQIAQEKGCARVDWNVLKWNAPSIGFYEKTLGAEMLNEWVGMRLEGAEKIKRLEQFLQQ